MDARNAAAATVFLVALSLSFGYLRVQATGSCSQSPTGTIPVTADAESRTLVCNESPQFWTIGSDICNVSRFPPYEPCSDGTQFCNVPRSDFLQRGPTIICCGGDCWEFKINPVVNLVSVPPVIQAGKEVTIYATIAAKPLPSEFPSLTVDVMYQPSVSIIDTSMWIVPNPTNDVEYIILHTFVVPLDFNETAKIRPRFSTPPEDWSSLVALTFEPIGVVFPEVEPPTTIDAVTTTDAVAITTDPSIATTINPMTTAANVATTSTDAGPKATMTIAPTTTNTVKSDITTMPMIADETTGTTVPGSITGGFSPPPDSTCIAADHLAAAVVVSMAIPIIIFIVLVCVFCLLREKKRYSEKSYEDKTETKTSKEKMPHHQTNGFGGKAALRNGLSLQVNSPANLATQNSITPTSLFGETPADEGTMLLRSTSKNHAANSPAGVVNPGYSRQDSSSYSPRAHGPTLDRISSRDSNSPTTPGDTLRPLLKKNNSSDSDDLSAAAAASTKDKRTEPLGTSLRDTAGAGASSTGAGARDPHGHTTVDSLEESKNHVYEELNKDGGLRHLPPSLRPLPPPPGSESVRQNTHPPSAAHHLCNHHQHGWDDGGHLPPAPSLEIRVNYPPMTNEQLLLGGENSSQCPAPLTHDSCPLDSSISADLYSFKHEGGNMFLPPQSNNAAQSTAV